MTTLAVIQPYFAPYGGYFRLFAAADLVVLFDCVQFPRRGWVHRNRLPDRSRRLAWLTLPLAKAPRDARICELNFAEDAPARWPAELRRFPTFDAPADRELSDAVRAVGGSVTGYLERLLGLCCDRLGLAANTVRSSTLGIGPDVRGQDRVIEVARRMGASRYVNPPGGRALYDGEAFARAGIELRFLPDWTGPEDSVLPHLLSGNAHALAGEMPREMRLSP
ncbi:MAG: WbqC family protein [Alphaproteobacteria bacterium]|nr:WbqC family protein [Alphaproteobacteria bacterium]